MWFFVVCSFLMFIYPDYSLGQYLNVFDINTDNYPRIHAKFLYGELSENRQITESDFQITENNDPANLIELKLPEKNILNDLSVVMVFDVSSSMIGNRIEIAKQAGKSFIEKMDFTNSECAITSFDHLNYLNSDFTNDKKELLQDLNSLNARGGTNYNAAFLMPFAGALDIAGEGRNKKVVILLTDGKGEGDQHKIIELANQENVTVFPVAVELEMPDILKNIAKSTGGKYYGNVRTTKEAEKIYKEIFTRVKSESYGELIWESPTACQSYVDVKIGMREFADTLNYHIPEQQITKLHPDPYFIIFDDDTLNNSRKVKLEAQNSDFKISGIQMEGDGDKYNLEIENTTPFILKEGEETNIVVENNTGEKEPAFTHFTINTDKCSDVKIYMRDSNISEYETPLELLNPNGGEVFSAGVNTTIQWSGIERTDSVQLYFSENKGIDWRYIEKTDDLQQKWRVPPVRSDENLIRVTQQTEMEGSVSLIDLSKLYGEKYRAHHAAFSEKGNFIITTDKDYSVKLWDASTGKYIREFRFHNELVYNVNTNSKETLMVSASNDGTAKLFSLNTGNLKNILDISNWGINKAIFDKNGEFIVTASDDGLIRFWNAETGELQRELASHMGWVLDIDISPDNQMLASAGDDNAIRFWDLSRLTLRRTIKTHNDWVYNIEFSPDGEYVATASKDGSFAIWSVSDGKRIMKNNAHHRRVYTARFSPDGNFLVTASRDGTVCMWDARSGELLDKIFAGRGKWFRNAEFDDTGQRILTVDSQGEVKIWLISNIVPFQEDTSDSTFRIVSPNPDFSGIDMGRQQVDNPKDTLLLDYIQNNHQHPLYIEDVKISGGNEEDFTIVSGFDEGMIKSGRSKNLEISFTPSEKGDREAQLVVSTPTDTLTQPLTGKGISAEYEIPGRYVDFGKIPVMSTKDTVIEIIKNTGDVSLMLDKLYLSGPSEKSFELVSDSMPLVIPPKESVEVKVEFTPFKVGKLNTSLNLTFQGEELRESVNIIGEGIAKPDVRFTGKVLSRKDSLPVSSTVQCFDLSGKYKGQAYKTGEEGEFSFSLPGDGQYRVTAEKENFVPQSVHLDLEYFEGENIEKDIYIAPIEKGMKINLNNVFFAFDEATLKNKSYGELDKVVEFLQANPDVKIRVEGHADSKGTESYNYLLSKDRAEAVRKYFIDQGIAKDRIETKALGETQPVAENKGEKGRSLNRRVEFVIIEK
ncbi:MAG: OmpA family protein [Bacteroidales bacterium]